MLAALARLPMHPCNVQHSNLVPALQNVIQSLRQHGGSQGWECALLASPLMLGLLSWATELIEQPHAAACAGPEAPLLVLEVLSHVGSSTSSSINSISPDSAAAARQAQHWSRLWRHAHAALGDAADLAGHWELMAPELMSTDMILRYYEACARCGCMGGSPSKSRGLGMLLRSHLYNGRFSTEESMRLLAAWAQLRTRLPFNPDAYNFAALAAWLSNSAGQMTSQQLQAVAECAPAFQWPVYSSMPLLHAVSREAVHRSLAGTMPLPAAQRTLSAAVRGATAMRPRLGHELQAATCEWMWEAPTAAAKRSIANPAPPASPPQTLHGAALAVAAECNNVLRASSLVPYIGTTAVVALAMLSQQADAVDATSSMDFF